VIHDEGGSGVVCREEGGFEDDKKPEDIIKGEA